MTEETAARLAALHAASFETPRPWSAKEITALLGMPGVFLCEGPNGFALGRVLLDECELLTIAVAPHDRRRGAGRSLLDAFEQEAARRGAAAVFLEVSAENAAAAALYDSAGYRRTGRRTGYYRAPDGRRIDADLRSRDLARGQPQGPAPADPVQPKTG